MHEQWLTVFIFLVAFLYSSVGHAGASGYIAVLSLAGWSATSIRPLALVLNVLVATLGTAQFALAGYFRLKLFLPVALLSIPAAAFGAYLSIPITVLGPLIGATLCFSAFWLCARKEELASTKAPRSYVMCVVGALLGVLAGMTGTGGGIFLSPVMYYFRWATLKEIAAVAAAFILVNSIAGLIGAKKAGLLLPQNWHLFVLAAVLGGLAGSSLGARVLRPRTIRFALATVLVIAGVKLLSPLV